MYNGNPHAPTDAWLHSIAGVGGYEDSEPGDGGSDVFPRDGVTFRVTVENITGSDDDPYSEGVDA